MLLSVLANDRGSLAEQHLALLLGVYAGRLTQLRAGGLLPPPEGYLREVREICRDHDVLFIADEVVTGYGRIGHRHWFASGRFELDPDMITSAKGLTSGYVPMGAMIAAGRGAPSASSSSR